ncbi:hypothetical protein FI667_g8600, partial [Globisporangium splendens]
MNVRTSTALFTLLVLCVSDVQGHEEAPARSLRQAVPGGNNHLTEAINAIQMQLSAATAMEASQIKVSKKQNNVGSDSNF